MQTINERWHGNQKKLPQKQTFCIGFSYPWREKRGRVDEQGS